jgi:hypothetical protein
MTKDNKNYKRRDDEVHRESSTDAPGWELDRLSCRQEWKSYKEGQRGYKQLV